MRVTVLTVPLQFDMDIDETDVRALTSESLDNRQEVIREMVAYEVVKRIDFRWKQLTDPGPVMFIGKP